MTGLVRLGLAIAVALLTVALCVAVTPVPGHPRDAFLPAGAVMLAAGVAVAAQTARRAYRHHRLSRALTSIGRPATVAGVRVHELPARAGAFVAGLGRPRIFLSPDVRTSLSHDELQAVLRHEQYHQIDRAPARLVLLEGLAPLLRLLPAGPAWLARRHADLEIAADRYALRQGSSRRALVLALLKLGQRQQPTYGIGFASATELRLRALVEEHTAEPRRRVLPWLVVAAAGAGAVACLLLLP